MTLIGTMALFTNVVYGRAWLVGIVIAAAAVTGCASGSSSNSVGEIGSVPFTPGKSVPIDASSVGSVGELPLDWFSRLQDEIGEREGDLYFGFMERCMAEAGFTWDPPRSAPPSAEWEEIVRYPVRYGVVTLVQAEGAAYRDPEEVFLEALTEESDGEGLPSDPAELEAFQRAWFGDDEEAPIEDLVDIVDPLTGEPILAFDPSSPHGGGCVGKANAWLEGEASSVEVFDVATDVDFARAWVGLRISAAFDETLADDRVKAAASEWRGCMENRGWEMEDSRLPGGLRRGGPGSAVGSDDEMVAETDRLQGEAGDVARAVDDVRCQDETEWLESVRTVEAEYQQLVVERVPDLFADVRDLIGAYDARLATLRLEDLDG